MRFYKNIIMKKQFFITLAAMFLTIGASAQDAPQAQTGMAFLKVSTNQASRYSRVYPLQRLRLATSDGQLHNLYRNGMAYARLMSSDLILCKKMCLEI